MFSPNRANWTQQGNAGPKEGLLCVLSRTDGGPRARVSGKRAAEGNRSDEKHRSCPLLLPRFFTPNPTAPAQQLFRDRFMDQTNQQEVLGVYPPQFQIKLGKGGRAKVPGKRAMLSLSARPVVSFVKVRLEFTLCIPTIHPFSVRNHRLFQIAKHISAVFLLFAAGVL